MKEHYSIKDLEKITGIKAHTLRIWEKRYGIVEPHRTETNIRYYTNEELRKILNVTILNNYGVKISKIVGLSAEELHAKVIEISNENPQEATQVESLIIAMVELDEDRFEKILSNCTLRMGFERTVLDVIYPFFKKVGVLWQAGAINPAQEHFISNLIRQKLIVAIDGHGLMKRKDAQRFLLFLPEGEMHELGLLFYSYIIQKSGHRVLYLGQSVPIDDVVKVEQHMAAEFIVTSSLAMSSTKDVNDLFASLLKAFPTQKIFVTNKMPETDGILVHERLVINQEIQEFKAFLERI